MEARPGEVDPGQLALVETGEAQEGLILVVRRGLLPTDGEQQEGLHGVLTPSLQSTAPQLGKYDPELGELRLPTVDGGQDPGTVRGSG